MHVPGHDNPMGVFQETLNTLQAALAPGLTILQPVLLRLIGVLVLIEVLRMVVGLIFARAALAPSLIRLFMRTSVVLATFYALPALVNGLIDQAVGMGLLAGGEKITRAAFLDPGAWGALGFQAGTALLKAIADAGYLAMFTFGLFYIVAWVMLVGAYLYMGLSLFVLQLQLSLALMGAQVLLPFATTKWTSWLAQGAVAFPINLAMRFFLKALLASVCFSVLEKLPGSAAIKEVSMVNIQPALLMAILPLVFAVLFWKSEAIAAGLLSGQPALTAGTLIQAAAGTVVAGGAALGLGGAAGAAGFRLAQSSASLAVRGIGAASTAYTMGSATTIGGGLARFAGGVQGIGQAGVGYLRSAGQSLVSPAMSQLRQTMHAGHRVGFVHSGGTLPASRQPQAAARTRATQGPSMTQQLRSTLQSTAYYFGHDQAQGGVHPPL